MVDSINGMVKGPVMEQPGWHSADNPFLPGEPIQQGGHFVGREDFAEQINRSLSSGHLNLFFLHGLRGIGKSSFLYHLAEKWHQNRTFWPVYLNLEYQIFKPLTAIWGLLARSIAMELNMQDIPPEDSLLEGKDFFHSFWERAHSAAQGKPVILLLDDVDAYESLASPENKRLYQYFAENQAEGLHLVLAQERIPNRSALENIPGIQVQFLSLPFLQKKEVESFIQGENGQGGVKWSDEAAAHVWQLSQGHPFMVQYACNAVWSSMVRESAGKVTVQTKDVERYVNMALKQSSAGLRWLWDAFTSAEKRICSNLADAGESGADWTLILDWLMTETGSADSAEFQTALENLTGWLMVVSEVDPVYRFHIPLFRRWIARYQPAKTARKRAAIEANASVTLTEQLFTIAQSLYQRGNLPAAELQLNQVLRVDAQHLNAQLLLGEVLLSMGQSARAANVFEIAWNLQPETVKEDYINALLKLFSQQSSESDKLQTLQRAREVDEKHPEINQRWKDLWIKRGETALQLGDLDGACQAFEQVSDSSRLQWSRLYHLKRDLQQEIALAKKYEQQEIWEDATQIYLDIADKLETFETLSSAAAMPEYEQRVRSGEYADYDISLAHLPGETWKKKIENVLEKLKIASLYAQGLDLLAEGKNEQAQDRFIQVMVLNPKYKDAAQYLLRASEGVGMEGLNTAHKQVNLGTSPPERKSFASMDEQPVYRQEEGKSALQDALQKTQEALNSSESVVSELYKKLEMQQKQMDELKWSHQEEMKERERVFLDRLEKMKSENALSIEAESETQQEAIQQERLLQRQLEENNALLEVEVASIQKELELEQQSRQLAEDKLRSLEESAWAGQAPKNETAALQKKLTSLNEKLQQLEASFKNLQQEKTGIEAELKKTRASLANALQERQALESRYTELVNKQEEILKKSQPAAEVTARLGELETQVTTLQASLDSTQKEKQTLQTANENFKQKIAEIEKINQEKDAAITEAEDWWQHSVQSELDREKKAHNATRKHYARMIMVIIFISLFILFAITIGGILVMNFL